MKMDKAKIRDELKRRYKVDYVPDLFVMAEYAKRRVLNLDQHKLFNVMKKAYTKRNGIKVHWSYDQSEMKLLGYSRLQKFYSSDDEWPAITAFMTDSREETYPISYQCEFAYSIMTNERVYTFIAKATFDRKAEIIRSLDIHHVNAVSYIEFDKLIPFYQHICSTFYRLTFELDEINEEFVDRYYDELEAGEVNPHMIAEAIPAKQLFGYPVELGEIIVHSGDILFTPYKDPTALFRVINFKEIGEVWNGKITE